MEYDLTALIETVTMLTRAILPDSEVDIVIESTSTKLASSPNLPAPTNVRSAQKSEDDCQKAEVERASEEQREADREGMAELVSQEAALWCEGEVQRRLENNSRKKGGGGGEGSVLDDEVAMFRRLDI